MPTGLSTSKNTLEKGRRSGSVVCWVTLVGCVTVLADDCDGLWPTILVAGGPGGEGAAGLRWFEFLYQTYRGGRSTVVGTASLSARAPHESYLYLNHAYYVDIVLHNSTAFADRLRTGSFGSDIIID